MTAPAAIQAPPSLEDEIQMLFPPAVTVAVTDPAQAHPALFAAEARAVAQARPNRQREFRAGRAAIRAALARMGLPPWPVPAGPDRAPVWPGGVTGSLSHSATVCVAALVPSGALAAVGVDIEPAEALPEALLPEICTLPERAWLSTRPAAERGLLARLIFSAKECAYKAQYMQSRSFLEFSDLEVTLAPETGQFDATFRRAVPGFGREARLFGRFAIAQGHIVTALTVP